MLNRIPHLPLRLPSKLVHLPNKDYNTIQKQVKDDQNNKNKSNQVKDDNNEHRHECQQVKENRENIDEKDKDKNNKRKLNEIDKNNIDKNDDKYINDINGYFVEDEMADVRLLTSAYNNDKDDYEKEMNEMVANAIARKERMQINTELYEKQQREIKQRNEKEERRRKYRKSKNLPYKKLLPSSIVDNHIDWINNVKN